MRKKKRERRKEKEKERIKRGEKREKGKVLLYLSFLFRKAVIIDRFSLPP